jgi:hypothetical protein
VLGQQVLPNQVSATGGAAPAAFALGVAGGLSGSTADASGNALVETGSGNRSSHSLDLQVGNIAPQCPGDGPTAIANVTGVQRVLAANIPAATNGAVAVDNGANL